MNKNNSDIAVALALSAALLLAVTLTDSYVVRLPLAVPLVFFFTGHLALRAARITFGLIEHVLLSAGISIAICLIGGFVLNVASLLTPFGWAAWVLLVIVNLSVWIVILDSPGCLAFMLPRVRLQHVIMIMGAMLLSIGAYAMAVDDQQSFREFKYTNLWLVPTTPGKFIVGIKNMEDGPATYDLRVTNKDGPVLELHSVKINQGDQWTKTVNSRYKTEATLFLNQGNQRVVGPRVWSLPNKGSDTDTE